MDSNDMIFLILLELCHELHMMFAEEPLGF